MCASSAVYDYFNKNVPVTNPAFDWSTYQLLKDVLKKIDDLDAKLGQKDCVDPAKETYLLKLENELLRREIEITKREMTGTTVVSRSLATGHYKQYAANSYTWNQD